MLHIIPDIELHYKGVVANCNMLLGLIDCLVWTWTVLQPTAQGTLKGEERDKGGKLGVTA